MLVSPVDRFNTNLFLNFSNPPYFCPESFTRSWYAGRTTGLVLCFKCGCRGHWALSCPEIDQFQGTVRLKHVYEQEQGCSVEGFQQGTQCTNIYFSVAFHWNIRFHFGCN